MEHHLAIIVPVLLRPQRVEPLLWSAAIASPGARVLFICDPGDVAERGAIREAVPDHTFGPLRVHELLVVGNYAQKINAGVRATDEPLLFFGADDVDFHLGWLDRARDAMSGGVQAVGVNDLIDRRKLREGHATHFLVAREYAERPTIDGKQGPLFEGYGHNFCDDEFIATARKRGCYAYAEDAHVKHDHPMAGGKDDAVYEKGRSSFRRDRVIFRQRRRRWR